MHEIVPRKLWIGNARDGRDARAILANGIQCVVDLAEEESPAQLPREMIYCRFPLTDGSGNSMSLVRIVLDAVTAMMRNNVSLLICCSGGMSRSPAIASMALSIDSGMTALDWLNEIRRLKPVDVSPGLWNELNQQGGS